MPYLGQRSSQMFETEHEALHSEAVQLCHLRIRHRDGFAYVYLTRKDDVLGETMLHT